MAQTSDWLTNSKNDAKVFGRQQSIFRKLKDSREYVKRRKVSGSTRSELGRRCRDTFTSLKKTCRKLGVSFWQYLLDRLSKSQQIPPLPELILHRANAP
jgi:hypothetical protein